MSSMRIRTGHGPMAIPLDYAFWTTGLVWQFNPKQTLVGLHRHVRSETFKLFTIPTHEWTTI
jgi:hypothetical protein